MRPSRAIASLTAGDKRGQVIEIAGATILNDSYNSNPEALRSMIRTLAARPAAGRRILVAGEMLEMGEHGPALHTACGRAAAEAGLDLVVGVQGNAEHLAAAACAGGVACAVSSRRRSRRPLARAKSAPRRRGPRERLARRSSRARHRSREESTRRTGGANETSQTRLLLRSASLAALHRSVVARRAIPPMDHALSAFRIAGNLYYVGSADLASYLIATPDGLILINSNLDIVCR